MPTCPSKSSRIRTRRTWCRPEAGVRGRRLSTVAPGPVGTLCLRGWPTAELRSVQLPLGMFAQRAPTRPCTLSHSVPNLSCCSLVLLTVQARSCRGHSDSPTSHGGPWTLPLKHRSSQPAAAPRGECSCLRGSAGPPFWASCPVSPPVAHPPRGSQSAPSKTHTRQCGPCGPLSSTHFLAGPRPLQHHTGRSLPEPSQRSS